MMFCWHVFEKDSWRMPSIPMLEVGISALIAFNMHKHVLSNVSDVPQKYAAEYQDTSSRKELLPPYIF